MGIKKNSFFVTLAVSVAALFLYSVSCVCSCSVLKDLSLACFGGSFVVCIVYLVEYFGERRKGLEAFYALASALMKKMQSCGPYMHDEKNIGFHVDPWLSVLAFEIERFDLAFGDLGFFCRKTRKRIYKEVYLPLRKDYCFVEERKDYLGAYSNQKIQSSALMELNNRFFEYSDNGIRCYSNREKWKPVRDGLEYIRGLMSPMGD